jgi:hypothetical protein
MKIEAKTSEYSQNFQEKQFNPDPDDCGNSWKGMYVLMRCPFPEA